MASITKFPKGIEYKMTNLQYLNDPGTYDPIEALFDRNDTYVRRHTGVILTHVGSLTSVRFTIDSPIILYAISLTYSDSGGSAGGPLNIYKLENGVYKLKTTVNTLNATTGLYKLCELDAGSYWFRAERAYITFTEWYAVRKKRFYMNINSNRYHINNDGTFKKVEDADILNNGGILEDINLNKNALLELSNSKIFKIETLV